MLLDWFLINSAKIYLFNAERIVGELFGFCCVHNGSVQMLDLKLNNLGQTGLEIQNLNIQNIE